MPYGFVSETRDFSSFPDVGGYTSEWRNSGNTTYTYTVTFNAPVPISSFAMLVTEVDGLNRSNDMAPSQGTFNFSGGTATTADFGIISGLATSNPVEALEIEYAATTRDWSAPTTDAGHTGSHGCFIGGSLMVGSNSNTFTTMTMTFMPDVVVTLARLQAWVMGT